MFAMSRLRLLLAVIVGPALAALLAFAAFSAAFPSTADARHSWNKYHWARTSNPFALKLGDNVDSTPTSETATSNWEEHLKIAAGTIDPPDTHNDWNEPYQQYDGYVDKLNPAIVTGGTNGKDCKPTSGRVEVCNAAYGENGWLGLAQIWISGTHIVQGTAKNNDTYFNTEKYNTPAWRQLVMCQEVAHDFGLDHQDETFNNTNLGSCMDYTNDPDGGADGASATDLSNEYPNQHDYDQLKSIYKHLDRTNTYDNKSAASNLPAAANRGDLNREDQWGRRIHRSPDGQRELWERTFSSGHRLITLVIRP